MSEEVVENKYIEKEYVDNLILATSTLAIGDAVVLVLEDRARDALVFSFNDDDAERDRRYEISVLYVISRNDKNVPEVRINIPHRDRVDGAKPHYWIRGVDEE